MVKLTSSELIPKPSEKICLVSYELAHIRLGGEPDSRVGFWAAYREALEHNVRTHYQNDRIRICHALLVKAFARKNETWFYRGGKLVKEKLASDPSSGLKKLSVQKDYQGDALQ